MAKRTTKPNLPQETLERARRELYGTISAAPAAAPGEAAPSQPASLGAVPVRKPRPITVDLRQEYAYVVSDLKNMGMLAAVLLSILVVLSFFL